MLINENKDTLIKHIESTRNITITFLGDNCVQYRRCGEEQTITIERDKFDHWKKVAAIDLNF